MLTKRAKAYSSSCSQIIQVYLYPYLVAIRSSTAENRKKSLKPHILGVQGHLKSLICNTSIKHATSACYDKQHVCAYPQSFSY